ncbi:MAG: hypothetical protein V4760_17370 [Bdellovibrionota bacterium]
MNKRIAVFLLHPYLISILNVLVLVLFYSSVKATWIYLRPEDHFEEAVELWDGFGTILLGFGVILEERGSIQKILGLKLGSAAHDAEKFVESVCHNYGVLFVILGVIIELFAWLVKIPNEVLDTHGVEFTMVNIAALAAALAAVLQLKFFWELTTTHIRVRKMRA